MDVTVETCHCTALPHAKSTSGFEHSPGYIAEKQNNMDLAIQIRDAVHLILGYSRDDISMYDDSDVDVRCMVADLIMEQKPIPAGLLNLIKKYRAEQMDESYLTQYVDSIMPQLEALVEQAFCKEKKKWDK